MPDSPATYLHLAGRTGRQGRDGRVISVLSPFEARDVGKITRQLGISIKQDVEIALSMAESRQKRADEDAAAATAAAPEEVVQDEDEGQSGLWETGL